MPDYGPSFGGIRFRIPGHGIVTHPMPNTLASVLTGGDENRLRQPFDVVEVHVLEDGFRYVLKDGESVAAPVGGYVRYQPDDFPRFRAEHMRGGTPPTALLTTDTTEAIAVLRRFRDWCTLQCATEFERDILAGELTFEEARNIRKEVFGVPVFQRFFATRYAADDMPKSKAGKRAVIDHGVLELYALACQTYHNNPPMTYKAACGIALKERPDLVPRGWRATPVANLLRASTRLDKSKYSQLSYRKKRPIRPEYT